MTATIYNAPTVAIIGGGAAGLTASIALKREAPRCRAVVLERMPKVGKKLLATGDGRCNLTNRDMDTRYFHSDDKAAPAAILSAVSQAETLDFFADLGLLYKTLDNGKVYPRSMQAGAVLDVLRLEAARCGVEEVCQFHAARIERAGSGFAVVPKSGKSLRCDRVILAAGGMASSHLGSDGSGYPLLQTFGHRTTPLFPALTQLKTETSAIRGLSGLKTDARAQIRQGKTVLSEAAGEVLFTDYGLSGPCILQISRAAGEYFINHSDGRALTVVLDLLPELAESEVGALVRSRIALLPGRRLEDFWTGIFKKRIGQAVMKAATGRKASDSASSLTDREIDAVARCVKAFSLPIIGVMPFAHAQVTAGGLDMRQFERETLESKCVRGVYACGEVLDVDGDCGGYNLQFAWSSGILAGRSCAQSLRSAKSRRD